MLGQKETIEEYQPRFVLVFNVILLFGMILFGRMVILQVFRGAEYREFAQNNFLRAERLPPPRGRIFDRHGQVIMDNRLQLDLQVTPSILNRRGAEKIIQSIAQELSLPFDRLWEAYRIRQRNIQKFQSVAIYENIPWELVSRVERLKLQIPGINLGTRIRRSLEMGEGSIHALGYVREVGAGEVTSKNERDRQAYVQGDYIGRTGLEKRFETDLRGVPGIRYVEVDVHNQIVPPEKSLFGENRELAVEPGHELHLTLDRDIQMAAEKAMEGISGAAVALDPRTGEILAMVSRPGFDPTNLNSFDASVFWQSLDSGRDPYKRQLNKTIQDHYSPGSTLKPFTALYGLEKGLLRPETIVSCPGSFTYGSRTMFDHKKGGFGNISMKEAIYRSSNVYFWKMATSIQMDDFAEFLRDFGFGVRTQVELDGEVHGLVPDSRWAQEQRKDRHGNSIPWTQGETLFVSIGQSAILSTPLQLAMAYGTLVNGGLLYRPYLVSRVTDAYGREVKRTQPELLRKKRNPPDPKNLDVIKEALWHVASFAGGTSYTYTQTPEKLISGKTGTSQVFQRRRDDVYGDCRKLPYSLRHHAWFAGYAPKDNPEIAFAVIALHECAGSRMASPIAKAMVDAWWNRKKQNESLKGPNPASVSVPSRSN